MPRLDRNARARLLFHAEALDRRTRHPGQHGGCLKRTGLAVLRALLFGFCNVVTARCDPSFDSLAAASGCSRSTVAVALGRLEAAGLLTRVRRQVGLIRYSNAYVFPPISPKSEFRVETTTNQKPKPFRELSTGPGCAIRPPARRRPPEGITREDIAAAFAALEPIRRGWAEATARA